MQRDSLRANQERIVNLSLSTELIFKKETILYLGTTIYVGIGSRKLAAVADVRHALSSFLDGSEPSRSRNRESDYSKVCKNLNVIEEYRSKGHSLSAIHSALVQSGVLTCTWHTFRHYYYTHKSSLASDLTSNSRSAGEAAQIQSAFTSNVTADSESEEQTEVDLPESMEGPAVTSNRLFQDDDQTDPQCRENLESRGNPKLKKITCTDEIKRAYDESQRLFAARCRQLSGE